MIGDTVNVAVAAAGERRSPGTSPSARHLSRDREAIDYAPLRAARAEGQVASRCRLRVGGLLESSGGGRAPARTAKRRSSADRTSSLSCRCCSRGCSASDARIWSTVIGDPGVGKSRLLRQFELELQTRDPPVLRARALPAVWLEHRLLAARRGDSRRVRDHRRRPAGVAWAKLSARLGELLDAPTATPSSSARRIAPYRPPARDRGARGLGASRERARGRAERARSVLRGRARVRGSAGAQSDRWCSCGRTSTGRTRACST